jgi:CspA family cold shock protein
MHDRQQGAVKFFNSDKGYGFILPDDGTRDMFIHVNELAVSGVPNLDEGDRVEYSVKKDPKTGRPCAHDVKVLD